MLKYCLFCLSILWPIMAHAQNGSDLMKIEILIDGQTLFATLDDTAIGQDFYSLLPLTLSFKDYASTEKISDLPRRLDITNAPKGHDPTVGDITYYAPWGNLAIFYRDFSYSTGLVKIGKIDGNMSLLHKPSPFLVRFQKSKTRLEK